MELDKLQIERGADLKILLSPRQRSVPPGMSQTLS